MKTVGEFKKAGVVFVKGDECQEQLSGRIYRNNWFGENSQKQFTNDTVTSFAWRDLTTKPDDPQYKIELDIANHRWRPSLNQGVEHPYEQRVTTAKAKQPEFKVGDLVATPTGQHGVMMLLPDAHGDTIVLERDSGRYARVNYDSLTHYNPELNELKDIIGTHDDPTDCAKAILAAGYTK